MGADQLPGTGTGPIGEGPGTEKGQKHSIVRVYRRSLGYGKAFPSVRVC